MKKNKRFFWSKCIYLAAPFLILSVIYFVKDPFMVLRHYTRFDNSCFVLNEHNVGWETYLNNRDSIHFNSFILGNSCTMAFKCSDWEKYLDKGDRAIRLYGFAERLPSVYKKLKALDANHAVIKNVLLVADNDLMRRKLLNESATSVLPPAESGMSKLEFQMCSIQSFFTPNFLISYCDYSLFHHYRRYMKGIINPYGVIRNPITCDAINPREKEIALKHEQYWIDHKSDFFKRDNKSRETERNIYDVEIRILSDIKKLCLKHHTNIKVVISPDYDQETFNHTDMQILRKIFGSENVFDFTGVNEYTNDVHNFYESTHYRPALGKKLLQKIYKYPAKI